MGGILLTASHNPGGETEDFGIKFNVSNGGPALEGLTNRIYEESRKIEHYLMVDTGEEVDIGKVGVHQMGKVEGFEEYTVEVIDSTENYVELMKTLFDVE